MTLDQRQRELLAEWLPRAEVVKDLSWGLVGTSVLELLQDDIRYVAKAGDAADTNIARELEAHQAWLKPWTAHNRAPELVHGDEQAKLLVTRYLPGELVEGTDHERDPETYRQAGDLLAQLHGQPAIDGDFEAGENQKALAWLAKPHRIAPDVVDRLRTLIDSWPTASTASVPTHGDWQPRNWLIHDGRVSVIDFGRAGLRPAYTDFGRLAAQQFRTDPALERAFLDGYGADPRVLATPARPRSDRHRGLGQPGRGRDLRTTRPPHAHRSPRSALSALTSSGRGGDAQPTTPKRRRSAEHAQAATCTPNIRSASRSDSSTTARPFSIISEGERRVGG